MAVVYSFILGLCSRFLTPKEIIYPPSTDKKTDEKPKETVVYLNVNLCHECWPDLRKWKFLTIADGEFSKQN